LYHALLSKTGQGQVFCAVNFLRIHPKLILHFSELYSISRDFRRLQQFSENTNKNEKNKNQHTVLGRTMAHDLSALAWPSGGFGWAGPGQPAWCGARGTITAPAMRKAAHPPIAHR
jgi:hypothetical protein